MTDTNTSIVVNRVSIDARISLRVWIWATSMPARSSVSRTAAPVSRSPAASWRSVTSIRIPALPASRVSVSIAVDGAYRNGRWVGDWTMPTSVKSRLAALGPQRDRVADPHVRLVVEEVAGDDQRVAVARDEEPALLEDRPHGRRAVRQAEHDLVAARRVVRADALRGREGPRLRGDDARHLLRGPHEDVGAGGLRELDLDVVVEVGERLVHGPDERRAEREHGHEHGAAEGEREQRQDEPGLAPERVADREQGRARRPLDPLQEPVEAGAPEAVRDARPTRSPRAPSRGRRARPARRRRRAARAARSRSRAPAPAAAGRTRSPRS